MRRLGLSVAGQLHAGDVGFVDRDETGLDGFALVLTLLDGGLGFLPTRLAEMGQCVGGIDVEPLRHAGLPDQRLHEPLRVVHIVEAEASLHA